MLLGCVRRGDNRWSSDPDRGNGLRCRAEPVRSWENERPSDDAECHPGCRCDRRVSCRVGQTIYSSETGRASQFHNWRNHVDVNEAAPQVPALPLPGIRTGSQGTVDSVIAVQSAISVGARIFDVGFDNDRRGGISAAYINETTTLKANGFQRSFDKVVTVNGEATPLYEWKLKPPTQ